ncbi:MAG: hypothetical protein GC159_20260 [Phycisphaera sp.]|nr:hypothetical protein [Phycisphaera sp.]
MTSNDYTDEQIRRHEMREKSGPMLAAIAVTLVVLGAAVFLVAGMFSITRSYTTARTSIAMPTPVSVTSTDYSDSLGENVVMGQDDGMHQVWAYVLTDTTGAPHVIFGIDTNVSDNNVGAATLIIDDGSGATVEIDKMPPGGAALTDIRVVTPAGLVEYKSSTPAADIKSFFEFLATNQDPSHIPLILSSITGNPDPIDDLLRATATPLPAAASPPTPPTPAPAPGVTPPAAPSAP